MKNLIVFVLISFIFLVFQNIFCATFINCTGYVVVITRSNKKQIVKNGMVGYLGKNGNVALKMSKSKRVVYSLNCNVSMLDKQIYCLEYDTQKKKLLFLDLDAKVKDSVS